VDFTQLAPLNHLPPLSLAPLPHASSLRRGLADDHSVDLELAEFIGVDSASPSARLGRMNNHMAVIIHG
jgi:hypothetical protein